MPSSLPPDSGTDPGATSPLVFQTTGYAEAMDLMLRRSQLMGPQDLAPLVTAAAALLGADEAVLYLADYEQRELFPVLDGPEPASIETSLPGRVFRTSEPHDSDGPDRRRLWVPLIDGVERLGVLLVCRPAGPAFDAGERGAFGQLAHLTAELLLTQGLYTDTYEWVRRRQPMSLPAEMQHSLLPPLTFGTEQLVISGLVAPAYEVGGDAFDYALNGSIAHVAVFDAMGHGLDASQLSGLAVTSYRNCRRAGLGLADTARTIDEVLGSVHGAERFVTALLGQLDLDSGSFSWLNAGHPAVMLLRGKRVVKELAGRPLLPLGLGSLRGDDAAPFVVQHESLEPGDRLLFMTDGVDEARTEDGGFFGRERLAEFAAREAASGLPTPEVLRRLLQAVLRHQTGELQDDALTLMVEWCAERPTAP